jgi:hypothetical protein
VAANDLAAMRTSAKGGLGRRRARFSSQFKALRRPNALSTTSWSPSPASGGGRAAEMAYPFANPSWITSVRPVRKPASQ